MQSDFAYHYDLVEQDIVQLCHSGLDSVALRRAAMRRLHQVVPFDAYCCGTIDPDTLLITSEASEGIPKFLFAPVAENEYLIEDVNKFSELALSGRKVGILSQGMHTTPKHSDRYALFVRSGFPHELRVAFVADGNCWGGVTLLRNPSSPDFTNVDARFLGRLSTHLAEGFQMALVVEQSNEATHDAGPGLIVLNESGGVEALTPAAQMWLADLVEPGFRAPEGWLPAPIHEVAMRARAIARTLSDGSDGGPAGQTQAHLRVRTQSGQWLVLHGSHMIGKSVGAGQTAVILERAHSSQIAQLMMLAYDLTTREREVLQLVLKGLDTKGMAVTLHVSANTVQDHFKSIFDKVGVRSRGELVARVLGDHYLPHIGQ